MERPMLCPGPMLMRQLLPATFFAALSLVACARDPEPTPVIPGTPVDPRLPPDRAAELARIRAEIDATRSLSTIELMQRYPLFNRPITYQPSTATNLDLIQASPLALDARELDALSTNGLVISGQKQFPSFTYGYESLYMADLPLYVSADSVLHALHSSYDEILQLIEIASLIPELKGLLEGMRANLALGRAGALGAQAEADVDFYLAVALSLLDDRVAPPVKSALAADVQSFFDKAKVAEGAENKVIFGTARDFDFSQFKPRGHYTDSEELKRYFRAMMWLGRTELRLIETQPDGTQVFNRRQLEGSYAIQAVMGANERTRWGRLDRAIGAFVGEADNMTVGQLDLLLQDLGLPNPTLLADKPDQVITDAIVAGSYGAQRISSQIMINGIGEGTFPLSSTFMLLGQRYVVDSHVFSNLVYDRVQRGNVYRMMPNPLDVAFAALGNDQAASLLTNELNTYHYAPDLHAMRFLVDAHGQSFWDANLYNRWLTALRGLSPLPAEMADPAAHGLPALAATEAFGRRLINTQLASWAELRHDTILYAKQSYTSGTTCEFPDAYVEPFPAFWHALVEYARGLRQVVSGLELDPQIQLMVANYVDTFEDSVAKLEAMAIAQRAGTPFTAEQMAFINEAVVIQRGCGSADSADGWFPRLYFNVQKGIEWDPTIADVHTQPTDETGNPVGKVLHVGTGGPRLMVTTFETCNGIKAYAGLASSYFERVTENFERLDDPTWSQQVQQTTPADVPFMTDLVIR